LNQVRLFITKLLTNEEFRQLAQSNASEALGQFQLSASERSSLQRLCLRLDAGDYPGRRPVGMAIYWW
jgi:hypothetical protein